MKKVRTTKVKSTKSKVSKSTPVEETSDSNVEKTKDSNKNMNNNVNKRKFFSLENFTSSNVEDQEEKDLQINQFIAPVSKKQKIDNNTSKPITTTSSSTTNNNIQIPTSKNFPQQKSTSTQAPQQQSTLNHITTTSILQHRQRPVHLLNTSFRTPPNDIQSRPAPVTFVPQPVSFPIAEQSDDQPTTNPQEKRQNLLLLSKPSDKDRIAQLEVMISKLQGTIEQHSKQHNNEILKYRQTIEHMQTMLSNKKLSSSSSSSSSSSDSD